MENDPAEQPAHWADDVDPVVLVCEPAGQDVHTVEPVACAYVPAGHKLHDEAPVEEEYDPAEQATQVPAADE